MVPLARLLAGADLTRAAADQALAGCAKATVPHPSVFGEDRALVAAIVRARAEALAAALRAPAGVIGSPNPGIAAGRGRELTPPGRGLALPPTAGRGNHHMANILKQLWASGKAVVNGWLAIPSGFSAEVMAQCGFDSVTVDMQHGVQDYQSMVQCFQAMQAHPVTPLVRVPWNEPGIIGKVLDGGAMGVICPMVNTAAGGRGAGRSTAKYPPRGTRSQRPDPRRHVRRGQQLPGDRQRRDPGHADDRDPARRSRTWTRSSTSPGITGVYIGPSDLGFSYGLVPKLDREEPDDPRRSTRS